MHSVIWLYQFALLGYCAARIPVVYITMGPKHPEPFIFLNFELTSRFNDVIVISDMHISHLLPRSVTFVNVSSYLTRSHILKKSYHHISRDNSPGRQHYERLCLIRWLILQEFMVDKRLDRVFFGDCDNTIFANTEEFSRGREDCDAMLMITRSSDVLGGRVSGHASIWSLSALSDFTDFMLWAYEHRSGSFREIFQLHSTRSKHISDMSLIWWWVAIHHDKPLWDACENISLPKDIVFDFIKPKMSPYVVAHKDVHICSGLNPVNGNVFDHMWPWCGRQVHMNFETSTPTVDYKPAPYGGAYCNEHAPKSGSAQLLLNNIHYQGGAKHFITYDLCRFLLRGGNKTIQVVQNEATCQQEMAKFPNGVCDARKRDCPDFANQDGLALCL